MKKFGLFSLTLGFLAAHANAQLATCSIDPDDALPTGVYWIDLSLPPVNVMTTPGDCNAAIGEAYFTFVAPANGDLFASTCGTHDLPGIDLGADTTLAIYSGCPASGANLVACNDDASGGADGCETDQGLRRDSFLRVPMLAGEVFVIRTSAVQVGAVAEVKLTIEFEIDSPEGCATTTRIRDGLWRGSMPVTQATAPELVCSDFLGPMRTASWLYQAKNEGVLVIDTIGTFDLSQAGLDSALALGSSCLNDNLACDETVAGSLDALVVRSIVTGEEFWLRLSGENSGFFPWGDYRLRARFLLSPSQGCPNALIPVEEGRWESVLVPIPATGAASCDPGMPTTVWFRYDAVADGVLTVSTCGTHDLDGVDAGFDTVISLHTDCPGDLSNEIACDDNGAGCFQQGDLFDAEVSTFMMSGQSVLIRIASAGITTGLNTVVPSVILNVDFDQMQNDSCVTAIPITEGNYQGSLFGAESDGVSSCEPGGQNPTAWYRYVAPGIGTLRVRTCGTHDDPIIDGGVDTALTLYSGCPADLSTELLCRDNSPSGCSFDEGDVRDAVAEIPVVAGDEVWIRVSGNSSDPNGGEGRFSLDVDFIIENDFCTTALPISEGTTAAVVGGGNVLFCGQQFQWFEYTATQDGMLRVDTCGSSDFGGIDTGPNTAILMLENCPPMIGDIAPCSNGDMSDCLDAGMLEDEVLTFPVTQGGIYYIGAGGESSLDVGLPFFLTLTLDTPTQDFCNGDGGDQMGCTDCPCGNNNSPGEVGGCLNESGRGALLDQSGLGSVMMDTLRFELKGANPMTFAVLTSGATRAPANAQNPCFGLDSGLQASAFNGLRCVVQNVLRHGSRATDTDGNVGETNNGWGPPNGPMGGLLASSGFVAGEQRHFQVIYRESPFGGCLREQNTSQGVSVTFVP